MRLTVEVVYPDGRRWTDGVVGIDSTARLQAVMADRLEAIFATQAIGMPSLQKVTRISLLVDHDDA